MQELVSRPDQVCSESWKPKGWDQRACPRGAAPTLRCRETRTSGPCEEADKHHQGNGMKAPQSGTVQHLYFLGPPFLGPYPLNYQPKGFLIQGNSGVPRLSSKPFLFCLGYEDGDHCLRHNPEIFPSAGHPDRTRALAH